MPQIPVDQKFHTLNANTPTKERGSAQADGLREIYTMQDIIDSVTTGGGINFTELGDTPSTYVGAAGQAALVNDTEDGLIFGAAGGGGTFEYRADTPASGTITFTQTPANGETITIGGNVITFVSAFTGSGNEVKIQGSGLSSTLTFLVDLLKNNTRGAYGSDVTFPVVPVRDGNSIKVISLANGSAGNSVTTTTTVTGASWGAATLEGGVDDTAAVNEDVNIYVKAVATSATSHGTVVYQTGFDNLTGLPFVSDVYQDIGGGSQKPEQTFVPFGIAYDASANGSFNTIAEGETFDVCIYGVVKNAYVYTDPATGLRPPSGAALNTNGMLTLGPDNGLGQPIATMLYKGTDSDFATDAIIFFNGGISSPFTRPTLDGVFRSATLRISGETVSGVTAGALVVSEGVWDPRSLGTRYRHYTSSDLTTDIVGIAGATRNNGNENDNFSVCINGLIGSVPVYDASGVIISTEDTGLIVGDTVYAGDGTVNPSHVLTTDPTSGVAVGLVSRPNFQGLGLPANLWQVVFQPNRLSGGSTTGEDLSLNVRSSAYAGTGDHEGTVLSIGTASLTVGTVYYWNGTEWADANAGAVATADGLMGVATDTGVAPDVLVSGIIQLGSVPGAVGDVLYLDTADGLLTATAPTGSTQIVRVMGYKLDTNRVYFNPSQDWLEIV